MSRLYAFPAICVALGAWQVHRLGGKEQLLATMNARLSEPPRPIDSHLPDTQLAAVEHGRVRVTGEFLHHAEMLVGPRNKGGAGRPGFYVYTPMRLADGTALLVNRGWVPASHAEQMKRRRLSEQHALPAGVCSVVGMVRRSKAYKPRLPFLLPSPMSTRNNDSSSSSSDSNPKWTWLDVGSMAKWASQSVGEDSADGRALSALADSEFFIEEVIDLDRLNDDKDDDSMMRNMLHWHQSDVDRDRDSAALPSILAAVKIQHLADPQMFQGKPVVVPPAVNVPNKHRVYIVTWFSLAGLLVLMLQLRRPHGKSTTWRPR